MKYIPIFYFAFILLISVNLSYNYSVFESAFELLHKGPPEPVIRRNEEVLVKWIEQKLDNFNESDTRTWKMRYMENGKYFKRGGAIFIFVGGEWTISEGFLQGGHMYDIAKEQNGYLFYTEHRYYGKSYPTEDLSVENLKFLSVHQSLADLAYFIQTVKKTYPGLGKSKVILTGGSYSATMVTWFQRLYPGIAVGSWASSAPLLAKVDFKEYKEIVGESLALVGGKLCFNRISSAFNEIEQIFYKNSSHFMKLFNICENFDIKNKLNLWSFFGSLSDMFSGLVQAHNTGDIEKACQKINSNENDLQGVADWILSRLRESKCNDFSYLSTVEALNYTHTQSSSIMRQWIYQTCSEYGWYQTSASDRQPFGRNFPVELYTIICIDIFGERFSNATIYENIIETNNVFGGIIPNVTNVVFTHGQLDPWRAVGLQGSSGESFVVPLYAHCKDFSSISHKDTDEMKSSKLKVRAKILEWLQN